MIKQQNYQQREQMKLNQTIIKFFLLFSTLVLNANTLSDIQNISYDSVKKFTIKDIFEGWQNCDTKSWNTTTKGATFRCDENIDKNYAITISKNLGNTLNKELQSDIKFEQKRIDKELKSIEKLKLKLKNTNDLVSDINTTKQNRIKEHQELQAKYDEENNSSNESNQTIEKTISQEQLKASKQALELDSKDFDDQSYGLGFDTTTIKEQIQQIQDYINTLKQKINKLKSKSNKVIQSTDIDNIYYLFELSLTQNKKLKIDAIKMIINWNDGYNLTYFNRASFINYVNRNKTMFYKDVSTKRKAKSAYRFFKKMKRNAKKK
jgi:hypothetical protein